MTASTDNNALAAILRRLDGLLECPGDPSPVALGAVLDDACAHHRDDPDSAPTALGAAAVGALHRGAVAAEAGELSEASDYYQMAGQLLASAIGQ